MRGEGLALRRADVDLAALAREAIAARRAQLDAAGIDVRAKVSDGVVVHADADRIHQALGDLLSNAARYCRAGDAVTVGVRAEHGDAVAEVADNGPGVPAAERPYVSNACGAARRDAGWAAPASAWPWCGNWSPRTGAR